VLRGVAVLLVLSSHYGEPARYPFFVRIGWSGVDLFFVLSGFLISGLLFSEYKKTGTIDVKRFWIRRGFKIYPPFYALIAITVLLSLLIDRRFPPGILSDIFFLQSYLPSFWSHGWSLAIEEHFYLLLPLLFLVLIRLRRANPFRFFPAFSIAVTVFCLYMRIETCGHTMEWSRTMIPTHLRIDALFAGVALGYFNHFEDVSFRACAKIPLLCFGGLMLLLPSFLFAGTMLMGTVGLTFTFLGYGVILIWAVNRPLSDARLVRFISGIGYYSYSIYLWHRPISLFFNRLPENAALFVGYFCVCIGVGIGMSRLLEIPSLRIRDRYFPATASRPRVSTLRRALPMTEI
jgi:peptidoglycan/LPS O-acetylase OafA/YrhL